MEQTAASRAAALLYPSVARTLFQGTLSLLAGLFSPYQYTKAARRYAFALTQSSAKERPQASAAITSSSDGLETAWCEFRASSTTR